MGTYDTSDRSWRTSPAGVDCSHRSDRSESGYSLIELVVAFFVLGIALAGFAMMAVTTTAGNVESGDRATAVALALQKMEELRSLSFEELEALQARGPAAPEGPLDSTGQPDSQGIFTRNYTITDNGTLGSLDANDIGVTVSWQGGGQAQVATTVADPNVVGPKIFHKAFPTVSVRSWKRER